jgi:hypothetical protein
MIKLTTKTLPKGLHYILDDTQEYISLQHYLLQRLDGKEWQLGWVHPSFDDVRKAITSNTLSSFATHYIKSDAATIEQLQINFPYLCDDTVSDWEHFTQIIYSIGIFIKDKTLRDLYYRTRDYDAFVSKLSEISPTPAEITTDILDKILPNKRRVFTKQVLRLLLLQSPYATKKANELISELGLPIAYYALRKRCTEMFTEKVKFFRNEPNNAPHINAISLIKAFYLFQQSSSPYQLPVIIDALLKKGTPNYVGIFSKTPDTASHKYDNS